MFIFVRKAKKRKKSYLGTLIDASAEALKRSKHCVILHLATKEKLLISNLTRLCLRLSMV